MRPHKLRSVSNGSTKRHFIVMGGYKINNHGGRDECHACKGIMDLVVLRDTHRNMRVIARNSLFNSHGSWGQTPDEESIELRKIGSQERFGWTISSGYSATGTTTNGIEVLAVIGDRFRTLTLLPLGYDDDGICVSGKSAYDDKGCTNIEVQMSIVPEKQATFYPILLEMSGTLEGEPCSKNFQVVFDEKSVMYKTPNNMPIFSMKLERTKLKSKQTNTHAKPAAKQTYKHSQSPENTEDDSKFFIDEDGVECWWFVDYDGQKYKLPGL